MDDERVPSGKKPSVGDGDQKPIHSKVAMLRAEEGGGDGGGGGGGGGRPWRTSANAKNTRRKTVFLGRRDSTGGTRSRASCVIERGGALDADRARRAVLVNPEAITPQELERLKKVWGISNDMAHAPRLSASVSLSQLSCAHS